MKTFIINHRLIETKEMEFLPVRNNKKQKVVAFAIDNGDNVNFNYPQYITCKHQCVVIKNGVLVNVFLLAPKQTPYNYEVMILLDNNLAEIWAYIVCNHRHEFWAKKRPVFTQPMGAKLMSIQGGWYVDNRPKVFVSLDRVRTSCPKAQSFERYNLVPYNRCEIAVVTETFKRVSPQVKHIILTNNRECENFVAIVCYSLDQVFEYIDAPTLKINNLQEPNRLYDNDSQNPNTSIRSYTTVGFFGMRKFSLHKKLRGFDLVSRNADYIRVENNKKNYQPCKIKNALNLNSIEKHLLKDLLPQWMMPHITLEDLGTYYSMNTRSEISLNNIDSSDDSHLNQYDLPSDSSPNCCNNSNIWIAKASTGDIGYAGRGIFIISNYDEYLVAKEGILAHPEANFIIQKYITDPVLFKGRKCHFRVHILVTSWGECFYHSVPKIVLAKEKYLAGDWTNKAIHDSHLASTDDNYYYPKDSDMLTDTFGNVSSNNLNIVPFGDFDKLFEDFKKILKPKLYGDEFKFGYKILGADIMFSGGKLILLEINNVPAMKSIIYNEVSAEFEKSFLEWEYSCIEKHL